LSTLTRMRLLFAVTVAVAFASLVALATFSAVVSAHQTDDADGEHTHADEEQADETTAEEEPITIQNHRWRNCRGGCGEWHEDGLARSAVDVGRSHGRGVRSGLRVCRSRGDP
jgi:hypothetical protein